MPASTWTPAVIDIPKRRHQQIRYVDELIRIPGYEGQIRQIAVTGLGRKQPTLFLTNNTDATARELVTNDARRNGIEDALGSSVNFFHQEYLSERGSGHGADSAGEWLLSLACQPAPRLRSEQAEVRVSKVYGDCH